MIWLGIDTANTPISVALVKDGELLIEGTSAMAINHSLRAMPAIEELLEQAGLVPADIDAIAVSEGPGSYTGARIGVTIAKTLAWTLGKPLVGVSTLKALAANAFSSMVWFVQLWMQDGAMSMPAFINMMQESLLKLLRMAITLWKSWSICLSSTVVLFYSLEKIQQYMSKNLLTTWTTCSSSTSSI